MRFSIAHAFVFSVSGIVMSCRVAVRANEFHIVQTIIQSISVLMMYFKNLRTLTPTATLAGKNGGSQIFGRRLIAKPISESLCVWVVRTSLKELSVWMRSHGVYGFLGVCATKKRIPLTGHIGPVAGFRAVAHFISIFLCVSKARFVNVERSITCFAAKSFPSALSAGPIGRIRRKLNSLILVHE